MGVFFSPAITNAAANNYRESDCRSLSTATYTHSQCDATMVFRTTPRGNASEKFVGCVCCFDGTLRYWGDGRPQQGPQVSRESQDHQGGGAASAHPHPGAAAAGAHSGTAAAGAGL